MRKIISDEHGLCEICRESKKTVMFEEEVRGYGGYDVSFEICSECFAEKLEANDENPNAK